MSFVMHIPDDFAGRLAPDGDLERTALEALALESFRAGRITTPELREQLGFETHVGLDAFLKAHGVLGDYELADLEQDRRDLRRLGL